MIISEHALAKLQQADSSSAVKSHRQTSQAGSSLLQHAQAGMLMRYILAEIKNTLYLF